MKYAAARLREARKQLGYRLSGVGTSSNYNPAEAAAAYSEALGAVLQVGDSAVLQIEGPLASAEAATMLLQLQVAPPLRPHIKQSLPEKLPRHRTRDDKAEAQQRGLQQEGLASLREAEASLAAGRAGGD